MRPTEIDLLDLLRRPLPSPAAISAGRDSRRRALYNEAAWLAALADAGKLDAEVAIARRNSQLARRIGRALRLDPGLLYWDIEGFDRRAERPRTLNSGAAAALVRATLAGTRKSEIDAERLRRISGGNLISIVASEDFAGDLIAGAEAAEVAATLDEKLETDLAVAAERKLRPPPGLGPLPPAALTAPRCPPTRAEAFVAAGFEVGLAGIIRSAEQGRARVTVRPRPWDEPKIAPARLLRRMRPAPRGDWIEFGGPNGERGYDVRVIWLASSPANGESPGELRPAPAVMVIKEVRALYAEHSGRPPNIVEAEREIRAQLNAGGYQVAKETLRGILQEPEFANQRRPPGNPR